MDNKTPQGRLKIYGVLLIFLGIIDVVEVAVALATGTIMDAINQSGASESLAKASLIALICMVVIDVFFKLFLGLKGVYQAKGGSKGTANIKLAWVALVIFAIGFVFMVVNAVQTKTFDWVSLCTQLGAIGILGGYIREAKAVHAAA